MVELAARLRGHDLQDAANAVPVQEMTSTAIGMAAIVFDELALGILRRGGFSDARAVAAFSGIIALNYGWSSFTTARDLDPEGPGHDVGAMLAALPRTEYPLTVDVADEIGAYGSDHHYDFVLDQLLSGLRATADAEPG
jgi:hypothetical protein